MKLRPLQNSDLKVTKGNCDGRDWQRVHVSLNGFSEVNKTYWIHEADQRKPETLARVKSDLQRLLEKKFNAIAAFIEP